MSQALDQVSSIDTTLPENIAAPPRSRNASFAPGSSAARGRTKSFMELEDVPSMAEIGMDEKILRDDTNPVQSPGPRRKSGAAEEEYAGINPEELKKRRMSSFMTDSTNTDMTLLE